MLTVVKNQLRVSILSIKYSILRSMINKSSFIFSVVLMFLSNLSFLVQWIIILSVSKSDITMKQILLIWAINAGAFGLHSIIFGGIRKIPDLIINGGLDAYLVQPKSVLIQVVTSDTQISAFGDLLYGIVVLFLVSFNIKIFLIYMLLIIFGSIIFSAFTVIFYSLVFFSVSLRDIAEIFYRIPTSISTYPDTIFSGILKLLIYTIIPIGFIVYLPVKVLLTNNLSIILMVFSFAVLITILAFIIFNSGLKRYSSSNLMESRT